MDRRTFLAGAGAAFLAAPLMAEAQPAGKVYRLGFLSDGRPTDSPPLRAFEETLRELGYVEGRHLVVDRRYAAFNSDRLPALAATPTDIECAFVAMTRSRAGAFLILGGSVTWTSRQQIADLAVQHRLPGIHFFREYAEAGLLLTYGVNFVAQFRRAATYVDKILKGAKPTDLPVEQPTKFELVINLKTAKALGLSIPQ